MGVANCKNIKCFYFCRNTPLDLHQRPSFSKENKWNKVGKRCLLLMEVDRWQHLSVENSSRQLFWGLWYLLSARKLTWLWCNCGELGNTDQGNWTLSLAKEVMICWLLLCSATATFNLQLKLRVFLSESHHLFSVISFMIKSWKTQPQTQVHTGSIISNTANSDFTYKSPSLCTEIFQKGSTNLILLEIKPSKWTNLYFRL